MKKGKKKIKKPDPIRLGTDLGFSDEEIQALLKEEGEERAMRIFKCASNAIRGGYTTEDVLSSYEKFGLRGIEKSFPHSKRRDLDYARKVNMGLQVHIYDSIVHMDGWSSVIARDSVDSDGQAVQVDTDLGILVALDGAYGRGVLIAHRSRAPFTITDPRKWRPSDDDEEPPPYGWRIGMFEGDKINKVAVTPIMVVADEMHLTVRRLKDALDWTLLKVSMVGSPGWDRLGEFPEVGAPDLSHIEDPSIVERLTKGLSRDGFLEEGTTMKAVPSNLLHKFL